MKTKLSIAFLLTVNSSFAQWSTSTVAESALYVCPGFTQYALTYDDGSSVIFGGLNDYRFIQKLDPFGYKVWPQPVEIVHTPGMNSLGAGGIDDGVGGWIASWSDHRGAEQGQYGYFNNASYMQRVDKDGNLVWPPAGIKIADVAGDQFSFGVNVTSLWSTTAIAIFGFIAVTSLFLMYIMLKVIKRGTTPRRATTP